MVKPICRQIARLICATVPSIAISMDYDENSFVAAQDHFAFSLKDSQAQHWTVLISPDEKKSVCGRKYPQFIDGRALLTTDGEDSIFLSKTVDWVEERVLELPTTTILSMRLSSSLDLAVVAPHSEGTAVVIIDTNRMEILGKCPLDEAGEFLQLDCPIKGEGHRFAMLSKRRDLEFMGHAYQAVEVTSRLIPAHR